MSGFAGQTGSDLVRTGLLGRCPHCAEGRLFDGYLKFAPNCVACGADFSAEDTADGPAVFVIFIASFIVVPLALVFQIKLDAPIWLTLLIFIPMITVICLALLRPLRGLMFALQVANKAVQSTTDDAY